MSNDSGSFDRRTVLQTIGATALLGVGTVAASGSESTIEVKRRLTAAYADEDRLRAALAEHAGAVVATLREEGFLGAGFDVAALNLELDPDAGGVAPTAADGRAGVSAVVRDGTATALGMVSTSSEDHDVSLYVQPQREEAYAFVEPKGGGDRLVVTAGDVEPLGWSYTSCEGCCMTETVTKVTWNCTDACRVYDTDCGCSCGCYSPSCDKQCGC